MSPGSHYCNIFEVWSWLANSCSLASPNALISPCVQVKLVAKVVWVRGYVSDICYAHLNPSSLITGALTFDPQHTGRDVVGRKPRAAQHVHLIVLLVSHAHNVFFWSIDYIPCGCRRRIRSSEDYHYLLLVWRFLWPLSIVNISERTKIV